MNKKLIISCLLISCFAIPTQAGHKSKHQPHYAKQQHRQADYFYDFARVSSVKPIIETIEHRIPVQCNHQARYQNPSPRRNATPMILGSIIGAAIGNELGHNKSNKRVGAVAGGLLGASIGSNIGTDMANSRNRYPEHSCQQQYEIEYEEQIVGYNVKYRYRGKTYRTQTSEHPGNRIQMKLHFEPVIS